MKQSKPTKNCELKSVRWPKRPAKPETRQRRGRASASAEDTDPQPSEARAAGHAQTLLEAICLAFYGVLLGADMEKLQFERTKYGKELLIDACNEAELDIVADTLTLNFYTLIFLERGCGVYFLNTERIPFLDHTVIFVKPGQINKVADAVFEKCYLLFFEGDFLDEFFNDKDFIFRFGYFHNNGNLPYIRFEDAAQFSALNNIAFEIWTEIKNLTQDSHHILRAQIYYLLVKLHRVYSQHYGQSRDTLADPIVLKFLRLLDLEIRSNLTVEQFSDRLSISRVYLNNLCQKYFAKSAHQLIRERMIAEIKKEIRYTQKDISEIAYDFNFSAPSHFARFFKQMTGETPKTYRDNFSNW